MVYEGVNDRTEGAAFSIGDSMALRRPPVMQSGQIKPNQTSGIDCRLDAATHGAPMVSAM